MLAESSTFALIAPIFLLLLASTQFVGWIIWRSQVPLLCFAGALSMASLGMLVQLVGWEDPFWTRALAFSTCYCAAASLAGIALAQRLHIRARCSWLLFLTLLLIGVVQWFSAVQPNYVVRVYALSIGAMALMGMPLLQWRRMHVNNKFDNYLRWVYFNFIVVNVVRTLMQLPVGTAQAYEFETGEFLETYFWLFLYLMLMVTGVSCAACLLGAVMQDVFSKLALERSHDPLTKICNRRGFEEFVLNAFAQGGCAEGKYSSAILMCDIDHFKHINDVWGHDIGDDVLKEIAMVLKFHSREGDVVARFGGEEFAIFLQSVGGEKATVIAQRMCNAVSALKIPSLGENRVTISIGVALIESPSTEDLNTARKKADKNLYIAKKSGRNRVVDENSCDWTAMQRSKVTELAEFS